MTIVATGWTVDRALGAAERLAAEGIQAEVIDPRTLAPLDTKTILESVEKTGRLVLVDQSTRHASAATVIAGEVAEHGFSSLKAPIVQVTALDATDSLQRAARGVGPAGRGQDRRRGAAGGRGGARRGA